MYKTVLLSSLLMGSIPIYGMRNEPISDDHPIEIHPSTNIVRLNTNASTGSMESLPRVNLNEIYNRQDFLKLHINKLISRQKDLQTASNCCSVCMMTWTLGAGLTTIASILISSLGASSIISPILSNVLTIVFNVVTGAFIWLAKESRTASKDFYNEYIDILKSLGVPERLFDPPLETHLELPEQVGNH